MSSRACLTRVGGAAVLAGGTTWLLRRMADDFARQRSFRPSTTVLVYAAYAVQLGATGALAAHPISRMPIPSPIARGLGGVLALAGAGAFAAGAVSFPSAGQLSGTETGRLVTTGIYRWTANPQYLGYLTALAGVGVASRSTDAVLATAASAAVFDHWIGHEETNLSRLFGEEYRRYRQQTPRWLGIPAAR